MIAAPAASSSGRAARPRFVVPTSDRILRREGFEGRLAELLEAGLPAVWLRARSLDDRALHALAARVRGRCAEHGVELWIGDRADVAWLAGADALQIPEGGLSIDGARRVVGMGMRLGRSVHSVDAARGAIGGGVDHLVVGTMYPTASHPDKTPEGPALLEAVREVAPGLPLYAIGGITPERVAALVRRGAHGVAAIGAVWDAPDPARAVRDFLGALEGTPGAGLH